ncbi:hypothetical protein L2E82_23109 [Cichorium intybus]|uniref:Uncharacterized protein n=1 Tax=Cichorium intybus TaxID=13427 RepID=A0ACB9DZL7_CICIN|nr:hypothetical protein L2E82_23109 [Cichorium intybus]
MQRPEVKDKMEAAPKGSSKPKLLRFFDFWPLINQDFQLVESYTPPANVNLGSMTFTTGTLNQFIGYGTGKPSWE